MLTNTATPDPQDHAEVTATTIAIEVAERRARAALRDVGRLAAAGEISALEAAGLETETLARLTAHCRELDLRGEEIVDPRLWTGYEARAARQRAATVADRRRSPRLRGLTPRVRAQRERQMCVVGTAHVTNDVLRGLQLDEDEESLEMRHELAAAGLL
jgi:hypothetical protein